MIMWMMSTMSMMSLKLSLCPSDKFGIKDLWYDRWDMPNLGSFKCFWSWSFQERLLYPSQSINVIASATHFTWEWRSALDLDQGTQQQWGGWDTRRDAVRHPITCLPGASTISELWAELRDKPPWEWRKHLLLGARRSFNCTGERNTTA